VVPLTTGTADSRVESEAAESSRANLPLWLFRICAILAAIWLAIFLAPVLLAPHAPVAALVDAVYDDCYFYLTIAANIVEVGHSTLDGVVSTNGYQPLWLLILVALAKVVGTDGVTLLRSAFILVSVIALSPLLFAIRAGRGMHRLEVACAGTGVAVIVVIGRAAFQEGLETVLILPILIPMMLLIERNRTAAEDLKLSALLALAFLTRLDALSLLAGVAFVACLPLLSARLPDWRALLRLCAIIVPTVIVYALVNQSLFGVPVPVSGLAKAVGGPTFSNWGVLQQSDSAWPLLGMAFVVLLALEWLASGTKPDAHFRRSIVAFTLATLLQQFYYAAFSVWQVFDWYYYLHFMTVAAIIARGVYLCRHLLRHGNRLVPFAMAAVIVGTLALSDARQIRRHFFPRAPQPDAVVAYRDLLHETGKMYDVRLLTDAFGADREKPLVVAMGDVAGALAYWGMPRLHVVQLEGLTLDMDYIRARRALRGNDYFDKRFAIDFLVVERAHTPLVEGADGIKQYVVADPIVGRVIWDPVPLFCFPENALTYKRVYVDGGVPYEGLVFRYPARVPCSAQSLALIKSALAGHGLRQLSLRPLYEAGYANAALEDRDRNLRR
jgi:hypothetical protein